MPDIYQTSHVAKVPQAAVVDPNDIVSIPTIGRLVNDPWVHVDARTKVDLSKWPDDRTVVSPVLGKGPVTIPGAGKAAKEKLLSKGSLVSVNVELPPDPPTQITHREKGAFAEDGSVVIEKVYASGGEPPTSKTSERAPRKRRGSK